MASFKHFKAASQLEGNTANSDPDSQRKHLYYSCELHRLLIVGFGVLRMRSQGRVWPCAEQLLRNGQVDVILWTEQSLPMSSHFSHSLPLTLHRGPHL